ncbi:HlyD family efflux transporter periplasmic adaptor subunit [Albirhodobacter sp. R86504]|uniref:HlyD family efflux transporter periplasmic adaptor subunit n=1 Tax=Albirhodobacter sp. R86504 TaxID=3093848 RepID=UPI00366FC267
MTDTSNLPLEVKTSDPDMVTHHRWFHKRYLMVLLVPLFMFTGAVLGLYFQPPALQKFYALTGLQPGAGSNSPIALPPDIEIPPKMAETLRASDVVGLARVMPRGDISIVAAPYGAGDARISEVLVTVGDRVAKGDPLARLDNWSALESAVLAAEANLAIKEAALMQTRSAVRASRDDAQAALDQAKLAAAEAASTLARTEDLFHRKVTTQAVYDQVHAASVTADLAVTRAEATLTRYSSLALDDQPDVLVAARNRDAATAELTRAELDLDRSFVVAPITGTILDIHVTPGQRPPSDGIMDMGDTSQMMAEVEIWQDRIASIAIGQPVELAAVALGQTLQGVVKSIGLTVGRQGLISDDAAENKDARVVRILVALDAESSMIAAQYSNLEVIARIDTTQRQAAP